MTDKDIKMLRVLIIVLLVWAVAGLANALIDLGALLHDIMHEH